MEQQKPVSHLGIVRKIGSFYYVDTFVSGYQCRSIRRIGGEADGVITYS